MARLHLLGNIKPSFMILGAQKAGTTSLHDYLAQHDSILSPIEKELHFFDSCKKEKIVHYHQRFPRGILTRKITFESTPRYLYYPETPKRLFEYNPNLKFIVLLREPVSRAFSAWNMYRQMAEKPKMKELFLRHEKICPKEKTFSYFIEKPFPSFFEWIKKEVESIKDGAEFIEPSIVRRGYYKEQILTYFEFFKQEQFLFVDSKKLLLDTSVVLQEIFSFLELDFVSTANMDLSKRHQREYEFTMNEEAKEFLKNHYKKKNKGLEELIGINLSW